MGEREREITEELQLEIVEISERSDDVTERLHHLVVTAETIDRIVQEILDRLRARRELS